MAGATVTVASVARHNVVSRSSACPVAKRARKSAVAGAIWGPHLVGLDHRVAGWAQRSLAMFGRLAGDPAIGIQIMTGTEGYREPQPENREEAVPPPE